MNNITLYGLPQLSKDILVASFLAIMNKAAVIDLQIFMWTGVFISFGKLPRRELQGHMLNVHLQDSTDRGAWRAVVRGVT